LGTIWQIKLSYNVVLICVLIFGYFSSVQLLLGIRGIFRDYRRGYRHTYRP
jgi:hypothetical protein